MLKNTLVRKAFNDLGINSFDADLNGTTAVAFGADETSASKVVIDNAKKFNDKLSAKSAFVDGKYVDKKGVEALASIPSREALVATLAGTLQSLIGGLAVALNRVAEKMGEKFIHRNKFIKERIKKWQILQKLLKKLKV